MFLVIAPYENLKSESHRIVIINNQIAYGLLLPSKNTVSPHTIPSYRITMRIHILSVSTKGVSKAPPGSTFISSMVFLEMNCRLNY